MQLHALSIRLNLFSCVFGMTGLCLQLFFPPVSSAQQTAEVSRDSTRAAQSTARTDSFETKLQLLQSAWEQGDFDLARSLTHSLRDTVIQTQIESQSLGKSLVPSGQFQRVEDLAPGYQRWAQGWNYVKSISIRETAGVARRSEPVEIVLSFPAAQVGSLSREIRVARLNSGQLVEVPSQVYHERRRGEERSCQLLCQLDSQPNQVQQLLVFYGNPAAELPRYPSDLRVDGEGFGIDISNSFFRATLSRQNGQLERLTFLREHGLELYSGGEGHGEPPGIDWAHDYVDAGNFQKLRISLWDTCPDYEVIRGPLCTIVRRWGFPHSPIHPVFTPSRLHVSVEYRFYSGLPWFHKFGTMKAVTAFRAEALRDDEWVFTGQPFTDILWMGSDGILQQGAVPAERQEDLWAVGFYNKDTRDGFMAMFLEHSAEGLPALKHTGSPTLHYRWHGSLWSRYPLPVSDLPAGATLKQKNAYVAIPFNDQEVAVSLPSLRRSLTQPLQAETGPELQLASEPRGLAESTQALDGRLARPGETVDDRRKKQVIWDALGDCKDAQLYTADISIVDLGLIRDVRVAGDVVTLVMSMPHPGRPRLGYFVNGSISVHPTFSLPIRERLLQLPGVRQVVVEQTWEPAWSSNDLTEPGREKIGLTSQSKNH